MGQTKQYRTSGHGGTNLNSLRGRDPFMARPNEGGVAQSPSSGQSAFLLSITSNVVIITGIATTQSVIHVDQNFNFNNVDVKIVEDSFAFDFLIINLIHKVNGAPVKIVGLQTATLFGNYPPRWKDTLDIVSTLHTYDAIHTPTFTMSATTPISAAFGFPRFSTEVVGSVTNQISDLRALGSFIPDSNLYAFTNLSTAGDWVLEFTPIPGAQSTYVGSNLSWTISFTVVLPSVGSSAGATNINSSTNVVPRFFSEVPGFVSTNQTRAQSEL